MEDNYTHPCPSLAGHTPRFTERHMSRYIKSITPIINSDGMDFMPFIEIIPCDGVDCVEPACEDPEWEPWMMAHCCCCYGHHDDLVCFEIMEVGRSYSAEELRGMHERGESHGTPNSMPIIGMWDDSDMPF